jgi:hypothetical protein
MQMLSRTWSAPLTIPAVTFALTLMAILPSGAMAQSAPDAQRGDRASLSACLRENAASPAACIGSLAFACLRSQEGAAPGRDVGCMRREEAAWRERLDASLQTLGRSLDAGRRARLAAFQRSFESYTAEKCALMADLSPPARAGLSSAACELREVAMRAVEVERQARRTATPSAPRIER